MSISLEVCVDSLQSAVNAINGGAARLEICSNLCLGGGTTPSTGLVKSIQKRYPTVPLMVMVRPRVGDFLYSESEIQVMLEDINLFKMLGVSGVVLGALQTNGQVDVHNTTRLVQEALPLEVTFHRAIDMAPEFADALSTLKAIPGITRVLTSGGGTSVIDNLASLKQAMLMQRPGFTILPGSGVNSSSAPEIMGALVPLGLRELHSSGGVWETSEMEYRKQNMGMGIGGEHDWKNRSCSEKLILGLSNTLAAIPIANAV